MNFLDPRLPDRFWNKVIPEPNSGCWLWTGAISNSGYGNFCVVSSRDSSKRKFAHPHRHAYTTLVGQVAPGLHLDHLCRTPPCCNPLHLEPVTPGVNQTRGLNPQRQRERHAAITHCPQGHEYSGHNLSLTVDGRDVRRRSCRACQAERAKARRRTQHRCKEHAA